LLFDSIDNAESFPIFQKEEEEDKALLNKSKADSKYVFVTNMRPTSWAKKRPQHPCQRNCFPLSRYLLPPQFYAALSLLLSFLTRAVHVFL
jgi:hypothetical protein